MKELFFKKGSYEIFGYRFYYRQKGYHNREKESRAEIQVIEGNTLHTITIALWYLIYICEEWAPEQYAYLESIQKQFNLLNDDDENLMRVLQEENFDFDWLIGLYISQLTCIEMKMKPAVADVAFKPTIDEHINLGDGLCDTYKKAASQILYKRLAKLHELDGEELEKFNDLLLVHAYSLGKNNANMVWLAEGYEEPNEVQQEALRGFEPEGRRRQIEKHYPKYSLENPPFTTEIIGWEDYWELTGDHSAYIFVRFSTADGEGYGQIGFSDLRNEAYLRFPDLYRRILELEAEQSSYLKKEQPVLVGLLAEGWDLPALAHSYAMHYIDVKGPVIWERVAKETGHNRMGDYGDYLERMEANEPPNDRVKWLQMCTNLETEVTDAWMAILLEECDVLFGEGVDYRIRDWATYEVMANASNFFHDFQDDLDCLYEGAKA